MSAWAAIERILVGSTDDASCQEVFARFPFVEMENTVDDNGKREEIIISTANV